MNDACEKGRLFVARVIETLNQGRAICEHARDVLLPSGQR